MPVTLSADYAMLPQSAVPEAVIQKAKDAWASLMRRDCAGNDFLGWLDLPCLDEALLDSVCAEADRLASLCDLFIVVGIGGSYIGARSAVDFIRSPYYNALPKDTPDIYFAGIDLDGDAIDDLLKICEGREVCVNLVSKSGTTTETAVAFRSLEGYLRSRYGDGASERIVCTCGEGPLKAYAEARGYRRFAVPDDVGGRFSVLSPVGLLPMAVVGIDISRVLAGAKAIQSSCEDSELPSPALYAAYRHALSAQNRPVELMALSGAHLVSFGAWLQQLFAESEGKAGNGILPLPAAYTTDLHSLGQFVQQGSPVLFETIIAVDEGQSGMTVTAGGDFDGLAPLEGQPIDKLDSLAMRAVAEAHNAAGVPVLTISAARRCEETYGALVFFFELACAVSSLMFGVNPFDQPGVEDYKRNMKRLFAGLSGK